MPARFLLLPLLLAASSIPPPKPPLACEVEAAFIGSSNWLHQRLLEVRLRDVNDCYKPQLVRIVTRQGGIIPPSGYLKLGAGFALYRNYWVFKHARVERRAAPNVWVDVPIRGGS